MKNVTLPKNFILFLTSLMAAALLVSPSLQAEQRERQEKHKKQDREAPQEAVEELVLLRRAYHTLSRADHDYHWHRLHAMHQTAEAATLLGGTLAGEDDQVTAQSSSDDLLRKARSLLQQARAASAFHKHPRVREHIEAALQQISIALSIR